MIFSLLFRIFLRNNATRLAPAAVTPANEPNKPVAAPVDTLLSSFLEFSF
ncbi:MAG: hypothetical protein ACLTTH_16585 [Holdemanella porci]